MGGYIRLDKDLAEDPRVMQLRNALLTHWVEAGVTAPQDASAKGLACNTVLGGIIRLWCYADTHLGRYDRLKCALHGPAAISEITGLPEAVVTQFPSEWLRFHPDGSVELPDYAAKNALINKDVRREKTRERVRKHRAKKRVHETPVTPLQELSTGNTERYKSVTTGTGTGTETGTGPTGTGTVPEHPLASALRHLADAKTSEPESERKSKRNGHHPPPPKTEAELESDARKLAAAGLASGDIAKALGQYGVTLHQVIAWLANEPAVAS